MRINDIVGKNRSKPRGTENEENERKRAKERVKISGEKRENE